MEECVSESMSCDNVKLEEETQPPTPPPEGEASLQNSSLQKHNSIFSLTLDEFQYKSGRRFGSMNMDEFLNSVWNADENQAPDDSLNSNQNEPFANHEENVELGAIPPPFCNKTVEEVWSEINQNQSIQEQNNNDHHVLQPQPQQTLGEMTLEDFLVKIGVIQEASSLIYSDQQAVLVHVPFENHCGGYPSELTCMDMNMGGDQTGHVMGFESSNGVGNNMLVDNGASMHHPPMFTQSGRFVGESSSSIGNGKCVGGAAGVLDQSGGRRRSRGSLEVAVERRQRRMIKNRESAARSRARKQAYTAELELELNQLRKENATMKLTLEVAEMKEKKELMKAKQSTKSERIAEKFKTIRRTSSWGW